MTIDFLWNLTFDELGMIISLSVLALALLYTLVFMKDPRQ